MEKNLQKQITRLKIALVALLALNGFVLLSAFGKNQSKKQFDEIDAKRINLVEENGKISMVIANKKRLPDAITNGRVLADSKGQRGPGIIMYNEEGDENGGYLFGNWGSHFSMDQFKQDQVVYMQVINGDKGEPVSTAGFWVTPRSKDFTSDRIDKEMDSINTISDKTTKEKARKEFWQKVDTYNRAFMGKTRDDDTGLFLFDKDFKTRMRACLDSAGNPKIEFFDSKGKRTFSLPQ